MGVPSKLEPALAALLEPALAALLEPALAALLEPAGHDPAALRATPTVETGEPAGPTQLVHVLIKYTGDTADLEAAGFQAWSVRRHPTEGFAIAAGPIPRARLGELETISHIVVVEGSRPLVAELNDSVPEIKADQLHRAHPPQQGAGVVIGIIDSGIDIFHHTFRNPDGTTRILGIWDQSLQPGGPFHHGTRTWIEKSPDQFLCHGVEYSREDIDDTLKGTPIVRTTDEDGHGTHVAGIAAGNGSQAGNCRGAGTFVGVAPLADLLIVKVELAALAIGQSVNLVNAFDWIWNHGDAAGKGVVVNLSRGDNRGPHDGTGLVEVAIDLDLLTAGRAVVKSAGNSGASDCHAAGSVPPPNGFLDVSFQVRGNDQSSRHLELWYGKDDALSVTVLGPVQPDGKRPTSPPVAFNSGRTIWEPDKTPPPGHRVIVTIDSRTADPRNGDNCIEIDLLRPAGVMLPAGEWQLHLVAQGPPAGTGAAVQFDCWINNRSDNPPRFASPHATRDGTITSPGTSAGVITVGAYSFDKGLFSTTYKLQEFSSYGPTRDRRPKPDICAPGLKITSAKSKERGGCWCDCCYSFYTDRPDGTRTGTAREILEPNEITGGTSLAAPHIAGVVALMLEKDKTLTADTIKQRLTAHPRVPVGLSPADLVNKWGAGMVDAVTAVNGPHPSPTAMAPPAALSGTAPGVSATPLDEPPADGGGRRDRPVDLRLLARVVLESPEGQRWGAVVSRHFSEVRGLINSNQKVAARWHHMDGPRLLRSLAQLTSSGELVTLLDGARLPDWHVRTARFLDVLERFGSAELRRDVAANREAVLALGLADLLAVLARSDLAA